MKQMQRDPLSRQKALRAERRADEKSGVQVITIKPLAGPVGAGGGGGGFKKGGFRNAFGGEEAELPSSTTDLVPGEKADMSTKEGVIDDVESESEDDGEERYDPRRPTGCSAACPGR